MFITKIAKRLHRGEKGFTLIELLVVMAILAVLVGLVLPNLFGITDDADAIMIQGQHEKMREAVYLYHLDTGEWPTEWSPASLGGNLHQLWNNVIGATGWDGPYIDRPILQDNRWGGNWGVYENRRLDLTDTDNSDAGDPLFTALLYDNVPYKVCLDIDKAMDDGAWNTGAVQWGKDAFPSGRGDGGGAPNINDDTNFIEIVIVKQ